MILKIESSASLLCSGIQLTEDLSFYSFVEVTNFGGKTSRSNCQKADSRVPILIADIEEIVWGGKYERFLQWSLNNAQ